MSSGHPIGERECIHDLMAESFFKRMEECASGTLATDARGHIVWMDQKYLDLLSLGAADVTGRPIHEVLPNSRIPEVLQSGEPIPLDLMKYPKGWCIVSRFPVLDRHGNVQGAFGFVLFDSPAKMAGMLHRFSQVTTGTSALASRSYRMARYRIADFVGTSAAAHAVRAAAALAAGVHSTVLVTGPSGTGKEIVAQGIHNASARSRAAFVAVNVSAVPEALIEVELFGAVAGAYTGADRKGRLGKIQLADKGTLFLDEVGDMPLPAQAKLLRFLEERVIEALGSDRLIGVDTRVVAATSLNLRQLVDQGRFRADLYYRLNVLPIRIPTLSDRLDDIAPLAEALLGATDPEAPGPQRQLTPQALRMLQARSWPGNVRELRNILERAGLIAGPGVIDENAVRQALDDDPVDATATHSGTPASALADAILQVEYQTIKHALGQSRWNLTSAARALGISRTTLYKKAQAFGLLNAQRAVPQ